MASSKALVIQSGITKQIPNGDTLLVGVAIDAAVAGPLAVGGALATSLAIGDNAAVTSMTQGGGAGLTTLTIGGGANVAVLSIGSAMGAADAINIGGVGSLTTIKGNLQVDGTETVTGISTFNNNEPPSAKNANTVSCTRRFNASTITSTIAAGIAPNP